MGKMTKAQTRAYWLALAAAKSENRVLARDVHFRHRWTMAAVHMAAVCAHSLQIRYARHLGDFNVRVKCRWGKTAGGGTTGGLDTKGRGVISLAMLRCAVPFDMIEYPSFVHDLEIGYLPTRRREVSLAGIVAHEVAHVAVYHMKRSIIHRPSLFTADWLADIDADGGHGRAWKSVYRFLRNNYVRQVVDFYPSSKFFQT